MAPMAKSLASVSRMKGVPGCACARTGAEVKAFFRETNQVFVLWTIKRAFLFGSENLRAK